MQHMIAHHEQALEMARLVPARTTAETMRLLAERIEITQLGEIARMRKWLAEQGAASADSAHHEEASHAMPGMIGPQDMARLAAARAKEFDRTFLELMIRHHEGAIIMVRDLFASGVAVQDPAVHMLASDIDADQRAEIARMLRTLETLE